MDQKSTETSGVRRTSRGALLGVLLVALAVFGLVTAVPAMAGVNHEPVAVDDPGDPAMSGGASTRRQARVCSTSAIATSTAMRSRQY